MTSKGNERDSGVADVIFGDKRDLLRIEGDTVISEGEEEIWIENDLGDILKDSTPGRRKLSVFGSIALGDGPSTVEREVNALKRVNSQLRRRLLAIENQGEKSEAKMANETQRNQVPLISAGLFMLISFFFGFGSESVDEVFC